MPLITIASGGDVILALPDPTAEKVDLTQPPHTEFLVCSRVLCTASSVFAKMLGPASQFSEAKALHDPTRTQPLTVRLDDAPEPLEIVLNAVHLRNFLVPHTLEFKDMVLVAEVCDKYDLNQALAFAIAVWKDGVALKDHNADMLEKLALAWVFRYDDVVMDITRTLLMDGACLDDGTLAYLGTALVEVLPDALALKLVERRAEFCARVKAKLDFFRNMRWAWGNSHALCSERCESLQYGHFMRMADKHGFNDERTWHQSVRKLAEMLKTIPAENCTGTGGKYDHSWNAELKLVVDEGTMELEKGLRLGEFPSKVVQ